MDNTVKPQGVQTLHPHGFGLVPEFTNIPQYLKQHCLWCAWEARPRANKPGKFDKIPHNATGAISTANPSQWMPYPEAQALYLNSAGRLNGVGVLIRPEDNLIYIDVDDERLHTFAHWQGMPTYCEVSPSGSGLRIISQGQVTRDIVSPVEVYSGNAPRFVTVTGQRANTFDVSNMQQSIEANLIPLAPAPVTAAPADMPEVITPPAGFSPETFAPGDDRSSALMKKFLTLLHAGKSPDQVLGIMYHSPEVYQMALDHRNQQADKVLPYLWTSLQKALPRFEASRSDQTFTPIMGATPELGPGQVAKLVMIGHGDLRSQTFAPQRWLIEDLLLPGVTMLVGKPKFGKSWLVHALMLRVAAGGTVFGQQVKRSKCLYMALEDSDRRVQMRTAILQRSMGITSADLGDNFFHLTDCERLGGGLEEQLLEMLNAYPDLRFITLDVLAMVRRPRGSNEGLFDYDYAVGQTLKKICMQFPDLCIVVVHHIKKGASESDEATSGTNGLNAGMDNVLVLMKGEDGQPYIFIHSRDIENSDPIPMIRGPDKMWTLESRESAAKAGMSETRQKVLEAIDAGAHTPKDIESHTGIGVKTLEQQLYRMLKAQILRKGGRGLYFRATMLNEESPCIPTAPTPEYEAPSELPDYLK